MTPYATPEKDRTHVCLISTQTIPNLLPILTERPQRIVLLISPEMEVAAKRLSGVVRRHGMSDIIKISIPSAYDFEAVVTACDSVLTDYPENELVLNVTGGTKIVALAAFQAFYFNDRQARIIYCDTDNDTLLQLAPKIGNTGLGGNRVTVRDCLAAYGLEQLSGGRLPGGAGQRKNQISALATLLIQNEKLLSSLNIALQDARAPDISRNISANSLGRDAERLFALLQHSGCGEQTSSVDFQLQGKENIFFCNGGWLEEFAYWKVDKLDLPGLDLTINLHVNWDGEGKQPTENEFDILFTHNNRLHIISCKTSNPERVTGSGSRGTEAINELDALTERAGGLFGRSMLLSARRLSDYDRSRAGRMGIRLVDGQEVLRFETHLQDWLRL